MIDERLAAHYATLGLASGATREEIRAAHRNLATEWHPDRIEEPRLRAQAEEKLEQIHAAFEALGSGVAEPPGAAAWRAREALEPQRSRPPGRERRSDPRRPFQSGAGPSPPPAGAIAWGRRELIAVALLAILAIVIVYARQPRNASTPQSSGLSAPRPANPSQVAPPSSGAPPKELFTIGSTKAEVLAAQGEPTLQGNDVWQYGGSKIYFERGWVSRWSIEPGTPLRVKEPDLR